MVVLKSGFLGAGSKIARSRTMDEESMDVDSDWEPESEASSYGSIEFREEDFQISDSWSEEEDFQISDSWSEEDKKSEKNRKLSKWEQIHICVALKAKLQLSKRKFKILLSSISRLLRGNQVQFQVSWSECARVEKAALDRVKFRTRWWCKQCRSELRNDRGWCPNPKCNLHGRPPRNVHPEIPIAVTSYSTVAQITNILDRELPGILENLARSEKSDPNNPQELVDCKHYKDFLLKGAKNPSPERIPRLKLHFLLHIDGIS